MADQDRHGGKRRPHAFVTALAHAEQRPAASLHPPDFGDDPRDLLARFLDTDPADAAAVAQLRHEACPTCSATPAGTDPDEVAYWCRALRCHLCDPQEFTEHQQNARHALGVMDDINAAAPEEVLEVCEWVHLSGTFSPTFVRTDWGYRGGTMVSTLLGCVQLTIIQIGQERAGEFAGNFYDIGGRTAGEQIEEMRQAAAERRKAKAVRRYDGGRGETIAAIARALASNPTTIRGDLQEAGVYRPQGAGETSG